MTSHSTDRPQPTVTSRGVDLLGCAIALILSAALVRGRLYSWMIGWDEGAMAHPAQRILAGELPHRDFVELWTGGFSYLLAGAFELLGPSFATTRTLVAIIWLLGLCLVYGIARRWVGVVGAILLTLLSATWTLGTWHYPLPNWTYFPLALAAFAAALRSRNGETVRWVVLAGVATGISFSIKITALYVLAPLLLWIGDLSVRRGPASAEPLGWLTRGLVILSATGFAACVLVLHLSLQQPVPYVLYLGLPNGLLAFALAWRALRASRDAVASPSWLLTRWVALGGGFLLGLLPVLMPFVRAGALRALWEGMFGLPLVRLEAVTFLPPSGKVGLALLLALGLLLLALDRWGGRLGVTARWALVAGAGIAIWLADPLGRAAGYTHTLLRALPLAMALGLVVLTLRGEEGRLSSRARLAIGLAIAAQLLQIPFAYFPYYLAVTPLVALAVLVVLQEWSGATRSLSAPLGVLTLVTGLALARGTSGAGEARAPLLPPRGEIDVAPLMAARWTTLRRTVDAHAGDGPIFVLGHSPETYFLLERRNPMRFSLDTYGPPADFESEAVLARLTATGVRTIVMRKTTPEPSGLERRLRPALDARYPCVALIPGFAEVRWVAPCAP